MTKLPIPRGALDMGAILLGKTRSGKSSTCRVCVEALAHEGQRYCIITPKDDWWGLKLGADGKSPGLPVVIFGGEYADIPINDHAGKQIAELVATGNRPCIVTLAELTMGGRGRFFTEFAETLFKFNRGRLYLVIDECHNFAPKGKMFDVKQAEMLHWANRLASEGLGRGITLISASQRPQKVHNDYLTSHETLIAKKVTHKSDRDADSDWIDGCGDTAVGKELVRTVADLSRAEAWVWSPEVKFGPERVTFPFFETYDSFKPQPIGGAKLKGWAAVDLEDVKVKLGAVVEEAKANDPKALKAEITKLSAELAKLRNSANSTSKLVEKINIGADASALRDRAFAAGMQKGTEAGFSEGWRDGWRKGYNAGHSQGVKSTLSGIGEVMAAIKQADQLDPPFAPPAPKAPKGEIQTAAISVSALNRQPPARADTQSAPRAPRSGSTGVSLPPGERAVLIAAAQFDGVEREQLTVLTGYKRSSRDAYIQRLREKGFIEVSGSTIRLTPEGDTALPADYEPLPTGVDLQRYWLDRLPEGERKVLQVLIDAYPQSVEREAIDRETGYQRSSRDAYLQRMKAKRLWEQDGKAVRAAEALF